MHKTTLNLQAVRARKDLQALHNEISNKIVEQTEQNKAAKENVNVLIDLSIIVMVAENIDHQRRVQDV